VQTADLSEVVGAKHAASSISADNIRYLLVIKMAAVKPFEIESAELDMDEQWLSSILGVHERPRPRCNLVKRKLSSDSQERQKRQRKEKKIFDPSALEEEEKEQRRRTLNIKRKEEDMIFIQKCQIKIRNCSVVIERIQDREYAELEDDETADSIEIKQEIVNCDETVKETTEESEVKIENVESVEAVEVTTNRNEVKGEPLVYDETERRAKLFSLNDGQRQILDVISSMKQELPGDLDGDIFHCPKCNKSFPSLHRLKLHVDSGHENYIVKVRCPICLRKMYGSGYENHCLQYHQKAFDMTAYALSPIKEGQNERKEMAKRKKERLTKKQGKGYLTSLQKKNRALVQLETKHIFKSQKLNTANQDVSGSLPVPNDNYSTDTNLTRIMETSMKNKNENKKTRNEIKPSCSPGPAIIPSPDSSSALVLAPSSQAAQAPSSVPPSSPWHPLVNQAARHFRETDVEILRKLRKERPTDKYEYSAQLGQTKADLTKSGRPNKLYSDIKKRLLFTSNVTGLPFNKAVQDLSRSVKVSKRILALYKDSLSEEETAVVERQLARQQAHLDRVCRNPPNESSLVGPGLPEKMVLVAATQPSSDVANTNPVTLLCQGGLASRKPAGPRAGSQPRSVILPQLVESEQLSQKSPAFADAQEVIKSDPLLSNYDEDLDEDESFFEDIIEEEESDEEISDDTLVQDLSETKPIIFNNPAVVEESAHQNT